MPGLPHPPSSIRPLAAAALAVLLAVAAMKAMPAAPAQGEFRCAALLPSASRAPPYARVPGEPRCEGYFEQTVSQPFIELLSLTRYRPDAPPPAAGPLPIHARPGVAARLLIQPLRPSPFYRVDAALSPGQTLPWNAAPMLASTGLRPSELGFLARAAGTDPDTPALAPVSLAPAVADAASAYAVLRVSVPVASVAARQYKPGGSGAWRELPGPPLYAWDTIVLPLAPAADGADTGVDVRAVGADGRLLPLLKFVVVGR